MPESDRSFFEQRFGYYFSKVLIHTDPHAVEAACAMKAKAFTVGRDVFFLARDNTAGKQRLEGNYLPTN